MSQDEYTRIEGILKPILIEGLNKVRDWFFNDNTSPLRSIFDQVGFIDKDPTSDNYYVPPISLSTEIPYPVRGKDSIFQEAKVKILQEIKIQCDSFNENFLFSLNSNQLLFLLEKYGGNIPYNGNEEISLFDTYKIIAARGIIASNQIVNKHSPGNLFINVDLSGIQKFIYNIVSRSALKNLRARSFFIELLCNHAIYRVIESFNLHQVNILTNGGGNVIILSSKPLNYKQILDDLDYSLNSWLLEKFNGKLHATFSAIEALDSDISGDVAALLKKLSQESIKKKNMKFYTIIEKGKLSFIMEEDPGRKTCEICNKDYDDYDDQRKHGKEDFLRCDFCEKVVQLGSIIPEAKYIYISENEGPSTLRIEDSNYYISKEKYDMPCAWVIFRDSEQFVNDLGVSGSPLFTKTYTIKTKFLPERIQNQIAVEKKELQSLISAIKDSREKQRLKEELDSLSDKYPAMLEHLAGASTGAQLIGALRMDADNMGKIIADGFREKTTIEKVSSFSRNLNYFFRLYQESLCSLYFKEGKKIGKFVHVIYSGGDDLFVLGAWNHIADLSIEISHAFKEYTCQNIDIGLSGGFTIHKPKFPVSKMAALSYEALNYSKHNRDACCFCRKDWISCPLFNDGECLRKDSLTPFFTGYKKALKIRLDKESIMKYSPEPSRVKLSFKKQRIIAKGQSAKDEITDYILKPLHFFTDNKLPPISRGFSHHILELLEVWYSDGLLYMPKIAWLLQKHRERLKRVIDNENEKSAYDLYEQYIHIASKEMLAALHISLSWAILLMKEGGNVNEFETDGRESYRTVESQVRRKDQNEDI